MRCRRRVKGLKACLQPYIEALLVDEELADRGWEAWDLGLIPDGLAAMAWLKMAVQRLCGEMSR